MTTTAAEQVGFRNQLRARWRSLTEHQRWAITIAGELVVALIGFGLDRALGYGLAVLFTVLWCRRMPPLPWRLATEAALDAQLANARAQSAKAQHSARELDDSLNTLRSESERKVDTGAPAAPAVPASPAPAQPASPAPNQPE